MMTAVYVFQVPTVGCAWHQLLSPAELAYCAGFVRVGEHLAARVAAKHAVVEALQWPGRIPWEEIEIVSTPRSAPVVSLAGAIERWRSQANLLVPRVSLSHAAGYAVALAWLPDRYDEAAA
ncbi:holo-ACP synthase [Kribbella yunnanensis]|uniref:Holo-ACP synthase n=1 Tax=Kribbella yunnanensis TaxID=190194 RepID=A0ABP4RY95_9ACTN